MNLTVDEVLLPHGVADGVVVSSFKTAGGSLCPRVRDAAVKVMSSGVSAGDAGDGLCVGRGLV
jgi:hypothetical protein